MVPGLGPTMMVICRAYSSIFLSRFVNKENPIKSNILYCNFRQYKTHNNGFYPSKTTRLCMGRDRILEYERSIIFSINRFFVYRSIARIDIYSLNTRHSKGATFSQYCSHIKWPIKENNRAKLPQFNAQSSDQIKTAPPATHSRARCFTVEEFAIYMML